MLCRRRGWQLVSRCRHQKRKLKLQNPSLVNQNQLSHSRDPDSVREMFGSIARRYDLANHLLSCGCDFIWRKRAAAIVLHWNPNTVVDLATGTGDLALALAKAL